MKVLQRVMDGLDHVGRVQRFDREGQPLFIRGLLWSSPRLGVYLHHYLAGDDEDLYHDHPAWNVSLPLAGWAVEETPDGEQCFLAPLLSSVRDHRDLVGYTVSALTYRHAPELHRIDRVSSGGYWSIWIRGRARRQWGFAEIPNWWPPESARDDDTHRRDRPWRLDLWRWWTGEEG